MEVARRATVVGTAAVVFCLAVVLGFARAAQAAPATAIIFLASPEQVIKLEAMPPAGLDVARVPALQAPGAQKVLKPFVGQELSAGFLVNLRNALQAYFQSVNEPFVTVTFPPQPLDYGVLQVIVTVSKLGDVSVAGNRWFDAYSYRRLFRAQPGSPIDAKTTAADIDQINDDEYRRVVLEAKPGATYGTTDLVLRAQDRFPVSFTAGIDNSGPASTGLTRINSGFDWGNAFGRADTMHFDYQTSGDMTSVRSYDLAYTTPFAGGSSLSASANYSHSGSGLNSLFGTTGESSGASLTYAFPLPSGTKAFTHGLSAALQFKSTNNNLLFGGVSVFPTTTNIYQTAITYSPSLSDSRGGTAVSLELVGSPGGIGGNNTDATFNSQQAGATANYLYLNATGDRTTDLGHGFTWRVHAQTQVSNAILLPSEQLSFGGYGSVRGFPSQWATRDDGVLLSTEIGSKPFALGLPQIVRGTKQRDALTPHVFVDFGAGWNHGNIATTYLQMLGVGAGFTYRLNALVSGRFDYGFALQNIGVPAPHGQAELGLTIHSS